MGQLQSRTTLGCTETYKRPWRREAPLQQGGRNLGQFTRPQQAEQPGPQSRKPGPPVTLPGPSISTCI